MESEIAITDLCRKDTVTMKEKKKKNTRFNRFNFHLPGFIALLPISVCELDIKLIYAKKVSQIQQFKTEQKICFLFTICLNRMPSSDVVLPKPLLTC